MIDREEWLQIRLDARLTEHATHTEDPLLRDDLLEAVRMLDLLLDKLRMHEIEIARLERLQHITTPYH